MAALAVDGTLQAAPLRDLARRELQHARDILATIEPVDAEAPLRIVADMVADELDGTETGALALEFDEAQSRSISGQRLEALEAATQSAALAT
jgi:hypothetical protein